MPSYTKGCILALLACALWSCNIIMAKHLHGQGMSVVAISMWRWMTAALCLSFFLRRKIKTHFHLVLSHKAYFLTVALVGIVGTNILIYYSAHSTTAINIGLISCTGPLFIIFLSYLLLNEPLGYRRIIGAILGVFGTVFLITNGDLAHITTISYQPGDPFVIFAALTGGVFSVLIKLKPAQMPVAVFLFYIFTIGAFILVPLYFITEPNYVPHYLPIVWLELLFLSVGPSLLAFLFWSRSIEIVGPSVAGMLYFSLPIYTSLLAVFLLGESFTIYHFFGFLIIAIAVVYSLKPKKKEDKTIPKPSP